MGEMENPGWLHVLARGGRSAEERAGAWAEFYEECGDYLLVRARDIWRRSPVGSRQIRSRQSGRSQLYEPEDAVLGFVAHLMELKDPFKDVSPEWIKAWLSRALKQWYVRKLRTARPAHESIEESVADSRRPIEYRDETARAGAVIRSALDSMRDELSVLDSAVFELYMAGASRQSVAHLLEVSRQKVTGSLLHTARLLRGAINVELEPLGLKAADLGAVLTRSPGLRGRGELGTIVRESRVEYAASERRRKRRAGGTSSTGEGDDGDGEPLFFTVGSREDVAVDRAFVLQVWAHTLPQLPWVRTQLRRGSKEEVGMASTARIAHGSRIVARIRSDDLSLIEPEATIVWEGIPALGSLVVSPKAVPEAVASIHFSIDGMEIGRVDLVIPVANASDAAELLRSRPAHSAAFASYSAKDRARVAGRIQGFLKQSPDLTVFWDVASLRSGDDWRARITLEILGSDVLYLFWSRNAAQSEHVDWEWRTALETHGHQFIDPVPLEHPRKAPPPDELSDAHFYDWTLAFEDPE